LKTGIWVVCFEAPGQPSIHSKQLVYKASSLINKNEAKVTAVFIGNHSKDFMRSFSIYGADEIIHCRSACDSYRQVSLAFTNILDIISEKGQTRSEVPALTGNTLTVQLDLPKIVIFPSTEWGRLIAADAAIRIGAGLTADCIDIEAQKIKTGYEFIFTRSAINSTMLVRIGCINTQICMCTCKENAFDILEMSQLRNILIHEYDNDSLYNPFKEIILRSEIYGDGNVDIDFGSAGIVFGIGRGVRDERDILLIRQIAKRFNAPIVGTRAAVEGGLIEKKRQVGHSGISISPDIYVAIGISGAVQHIIGIKNAKTIIAINTDKEALIFSYSDYCVNENFRDIFTIT